MSRAAANLCEKQSLHLLQQLPRFTQQGLNPLSLGDRVAGEQAVLARVLVSPWRAASRRAAVHAAALFAAHRRRAARAAGTDFCPATRARQHRTGIAGVIAHACVCRLASAGSCSCAPQSGIDTIRASVTAGAGLLSEKITRMLRDIADNGLAAILNRHVLHGDGRLAIVAIAVERLHLGRKRAGQPA